MDTQDGMTAGPAADKRRPATQPVEPMRHVFGPRPLAALLPAVTRPAFRRRPPATAQVLTDWAIIVGPAMAAVTLPRRLAAGTLSIACAGPVAMELQHQAATLIARINAYLGHDTVQRLRLVQDAIGPPPAPPPPPPAPAYAVAAAEQAVAGLPPGPLRDALSALGRAVLTASTDPGHER